MRIAVVMKQVPDLVEEFEVGPDGDDIDREFMSFVANEFDGHALEEALLVKDAVGAEVVVLALDDPEIDQVLYTALAKGADSAVKLTGLVDEETWLDTHTRSAALASWIEGENVDLVLTGVQAADDLDGQLAPMLGARLGVPHVSVVVGVELNDNSARVRQEFSGGVVSELDIDLPAVLGVQASREEPRYAPISKIRQAQQDGGLAEVEAAPSGGGSGVTVRRMYPPETTDHAEMLTGDPGDVADRIIELVRERGLAQS